MPKLSIITINLNNATGLQKTMESVFAQTFTDYEYIIIDGGSTDGSTELIKKEENKLVYWVSEKDSGIYNAMNKGIVKAKGEYLLFLNSGDYFYSNDSLGLFFSNSNNEDIIYGNISVKTDLEDYVKTYPDFLSFVYFLEDTLPHPASLIRRGLFSKIGMYNEQNSIISDWEFFIKAICRESVTYKYINQVITVFHYDGISSIPENSTIIADEKKAVLNKAFAAFLPDYAEHQARFNSLQNISNFSLNTNFRRFSNSTITRFLRPFWKKH